MSLAVVIGSPRICSGLAWSGVSTRQSACVTAIVCIIWRSSSILAMPKSSSFGVPSRATRMFDGFRSRCTIRFWCAR